MDPIESFFSGGGGIDYSKPLLTEEQRKKLAAAAAAPTKGELPSAKPTNGPLPTVASVKAGVGAPNIVQQGVDIRPTEAGKLVASNAQPVVTRKMVSGETVPKASSNPENLKKGRKVYSEFASAFR